ncbi:ER membrane protein complex subunit 4 [Cocos nucifera]|uniref:ER membrane protein complex subunit 4 n=1 Tax=Cocos nucifera TaxID=13894 RepID=A0A8K0N9X6_COCNU|nr:ER membrane protein complex subunit 4 [Cocos nucifera]
MFAESPSSFSYDVPDPLGFNRSSQDLDDANGGRQKKDAEAAWKAQINWLLQRPTYELQSSGNSGATLRSLDTGNDLAKKGEVFEPYKDSRADILAPKLLFIALNLAGLALGVWKLNTLGLLPTHASDWVSSLAPAQANGEWDTCVKTCF